MTPHQTTKHRTLLFLGEHIPALKQFSEEAAKESVQTTVWLVGLSTGFLAMLAAKPELLALLNQLRPWILTGLLSVVIVGLLQRLVMQIAMARMQNVWFQLTAYVAGWTDTSGSPLPLQDWWNAQEILRRLRNEFGFEHIIPEQIEVPLEKLQTLYRSQYELWEKREQEDQAELTSLRFAMVGRHPPQPTSNVSAARSGDNLADIREAGRSLVKWDRAARILYMLVGVLFVSVTTLVAAALF